MNLSDLIGITGGSQGGPLVVRGIANVDVTLPDGMLIGIISVRSDVALVTVTLPAIVSTQGCGVVLSCPDGGANNVTIATPGADTIFGGAALTVAADNLIVLIAVPGTTDWEGHVGT